MALAVAALWLPLNGWANETAFPEEITAKGSSKGAGEVLPFTWTPSPVLPELGEFAHALFWADSRTRGNLDGSVANYLRSKKRWFSTAPAIADYIRQNSTEQDTITGASDYAPLIALLADGHLLVEGAPGLAKTTAVKALASHIEREPTLERAFAAFEAQRKPDAKAIQRMALENYIEMRDKVDDAGYLLQRQLELALQERHPGRFVPHYAMVSFMRIPYSVALQRSEVQKTILEEATRGISSLDEVDWAAADSAVLAKLQPLI